MSTCTRVGSVLDVNLATVNNDNAHIAVTGGGPSPSARLPEPMSAPTGTVNNVDLVEVDQPSVGPPFLNGFVTIYVPLGGFGPGATATGEGDGSQEIEFDVNLGSHNNDGGAFGDLVSIRTADFTAADENDHFRIGNLGPGVNGANLNAPEAGGADSDVEMTDVEFVDVDTGDAESEENILDATGGPEFAGPIIGR